MNAQGLPELERIRRRADFERVYNDGVRVNGRFMTIFRLPTGLPQTRLGVAATRKLGSAVERNRAKRLARELFRRNKIAMGHDIVVVPRREMLDAPFASLQADYQTAIERRGQPRTGPRRGGARRARPATRL
jgi:ribonuclease P protein component